MSRSSKVNCALVESNGLVSVKAELPIGIDDWPCPSSVPVLDVL